MYGFAVLVVCGLYVGLALFGTRRVWRTTESKLARYGIMVICGLIPVWDILPGQLYHRYLCKTQGGVKVLKTIEIPATYFLSNGQPDEKKIHEDFVDWEGEPDRAFSRLFHMTKNQDSLVDKHTRERLGTATDFWHYGGWLKVMVLPDALSTICPEYPHFSVSNSLLREVVRPQTTAQ
jgi:hypothetical protein